jgi:thiamine biosynthesis lipoprotein
MADLMSPPHPLLASAAADPGEPGWLFEFQAMASPCRIHLVGPDEAVATRLATAAVAEVRRIEATWSRYRSDSVVSQINAAAGRGRAVSVDTETAQLLNFAAQLHDISGGLFDLTSGVLRRVWDFKQPRLPDEAELDAARRLIGWDRVHWDGRAISLPEVGMELDFGGIGKEYAVDRVATLLMEAGQHSGLVNLGGDLRVLGPHPDGRPWSLGVAHPREPGQVLLHWPLTQGALATSGDYERYFELGGQRYCHLLNPLTGWPVQHWRSVSVVAPACLAAGALSTVAMLSGPGALEVLREQHVDFVAIDATGRTYSSVMDLT